MRRSSHQVSKRPWQRQQEGLSGEQLSTLISLRPACCAHCGLRSVRPGDRDHMCMGFLFDWLEALDGENRAREYGEIMALINELGV